MCLQFHKPTPTQLKKKSYKKYTTAAIYTYIYIHVLYILCTHRAQQCFSDIVISINNTFYIAICGAYTTVV